MDLLQRIRTLYDEVAPSLQASGCIVEITEFRLSSSKPSIAVTVGLPNRIGRLTLWATGEAELNLGDVETGEVVEEHRDITGDLGLTDAIQMLIAWVRLA